MRKTIIYTTLIILTYACVSKYIPTTYIGSWQEKELEFTESIGHRESNSLLSYITSEKWCCNSSSDYKWLRNEDNLWTTYNIVKKIGIENFISKEEFNEQLFQDDYWDFDWEDLSLNDIVQKLITSHQLMTDTSDYYQKFWKRRRTDKNDSITFIILNDINNIYNHNSEKRYDSKSIDTTLFALIQHNVVFNNADSTNKTSISLEYFNYLKSIKLEHSAYNLVFELDETSNLSLNKDSLLQTLKYDTIQEEKYWQTRNSAQWIKTYRDNGP